MCPLYNFYIYISFNTNSPLTKNSCLLLGNRDEWRNVFDRAGDAGWLFPGPNSSCCAGHETQILAFQCCTKNIRKNKNEKAQ